MVVKDNKVPGLVSPQPVSKPKGPPVLASRGPPPIWPQPKVKLPLLLRDPAHPCTLDCCANLHGQAWLTHKQNNHPFDIKVLARIIRQKYDIMSIKGYLNAFDKDQLRTGLSNLVLGDNPEKNGFWRCPILYYAAEQHSPDLVRALCEAGANPEHVSPEYRIPLLAYTIVSAENELVDPTDTVSALLAMGCPPRHVPQLLWEDYIETPLKGARELIARKTTEHWWTEELLLALARNLTLMQRYFLFKASLLKPPTKRMLQIARAFDFLPLFETPYHIIGQSHSTNHIIETIVAHYLYDADKPLTLLLTGMSGHGKTEISKQMGGLLSLPLLRIDMTEMKHETDLFGPKAPYQGSEAGSALNNFLAANTGKRCVVFMDEFEKTTKTVHQSLLLLLESGFYQDRRSLTPIDAKSVIWILAANLGTDSIHKFYESHLKESSPALQAKAPYESLNRDLATQFTTELGAPLVGRLSSIVPFFPFTAAEQAVTCYKFMRELWTMVRSPIIVEKKKFARHTFLGFGNDGALATHLAKKNYSPETGARSLEKAVHFEIRRRLAFKQLEVGDEFKDADNEGALQHFEVKLEGGDGKGKPKGGKGREDDLRVVVERMGEKDLLSKKMAKEAKASQVLVKKEEAEEEL